MTVSKILDIILPYTSEELRCGFKKRNKSVQRIKLAEMINQYKENKAVDFSSLLPTDKTNQLLKLLA